MKLDNLGKSIDKLLEKLKTTENQVTYLRKRESNLLATIDNLQAQLANTEEKIQQIISRLKTVEEKV